MKISEMPNEIFELKQRVDKLENELKVLRWLVSRKTDEKCYNPYTWNKNYNRDKAKDGRKFNRYAWNGYSNRDEQKKRNENDRFYNEKPRKRETNRNPGLRYENSIKRGSQFHEKAFENSKLNQPESMEINVLKRQKQNKTKTKEKIQTSGKDPIRTVSNQKKEANLVEGTLLKNKSKMNSALKCIKTDHSKIPVLKSISAKKQIPTEQDRIGKSKKTGIQTEVESKTMKANSLNSSSISLETKKDLITFKRRNIHTGKELIGLIDY